MPSLLSSLSSVWFRESFEERDQAELNRLISGIQGRSGEPDLRTGAVPVLGNDSPYRGIKVFDVKDARFFFGREALKGRLLHLLRPATGPRQELRCFSILGPSGSGKSSLARAGLMAGLLDGAIPGSERWPQAICRPLANPLQSLAQEAASALGLSGDLPALMDELVQEESALHRWVEGTLGGEPERRFVLLIDQFEELFTLCRDEEVRRAFLDALLYAAGVVGGQTVVVLSMRTDFYGRCAAYSALATAMSNQQVLVGAMSRSELREAIERPARLAGVTFETDLVATLLLETGHEPGALPLLQHVLLELWERCRRRGGHELTQDDYEAVGRIEGALEKRAEKIYGELGEEERQLCRRIFLRLVQPGEGTEATRRNVPLQELIADPGEGEKIERILRRLEAQEARLLTAEAEVGSGGESTVEISHEALIRSWARLREWIERDRQSLRIRTRLAEKAREWQGSQGDESLLRGLQLAETVEWSKAHGDEVTPQEQELIQRSLDRYLEESRLSGAATLDWLKASAQDPGLWSSVPGLQAWLDRGQKVIELLLPLRQQLERLRSEQAAGWEGTFQIDTLAMLIGRLERFQGGLLAAARHRAEVLPRLAELTVEAHREAWEEVAGSVALPPQEGLIPLGRDPRSGLWEFAHLATGPPARRGPAGELEIDERTGIVLVLIPGGSFRMGAERPSAGRPLGSPNVDPEARDDEGPVHTVTLAPYFIAKHPMTQGQWLHAAGSNPSYFRSGSTVGAHLRYPVECVSWDECREALTPLGLDLPTEAQWEHAARAGTTTPWWTGDDPEEVLRVANMASTGPTPVGHFAAPNPFGLYDVIGNVWEWCRDLYGPLTAPVRPGDGERGVPDGTERISRGGSFFNFPAFGRSAIRYFHTPPGARFNNRGVRPARRLR